MTSIKNTSIDNIYQLDGRVPIGKAIPFGLQHVLAMFVGNLTPILPLLLLWQEHQDFLVSKQLLLSNVLCSLQE